MNSFLAEIFAARGLWIAFLIMLYLYLATSALAARDRSERLKLMMGIANKKRDAHYELSEFEPGWIQKP